MSTYTVIERGGCRIVTGDLPMASMGMLLYGFPEGAVMDSALARMLNAVLAIGMPEDLAKLKNDSNLLAKATNRAAGSAKWLSREAAEWLATGQRGASSETMFHRFTGIASLDRKGYPLDPDDFKRCRLLLEQVPEFQPMLPKMADVSREWAAIVRNWTTLCEQMDAESPEWREGKGSAPETCRLLQLAVKPDAIDEGE